MIDCEPAWWKWIIIGNLRLFSAQSSLTSVSTYPNPSYARAIIFYSLSMTFTAPDICCCAIGCAIQYINCDGWSCSPDSQWVWNNHTNLSGDGVAAPSMLDPTRRGPSLPHRTGNRSGDHCRQSCTCSSSDWKIDRLHRTPQRPLPPANRHARRLSFAPCWASQRRGSICPCWFVLPAAI